MLLLQPTRNAQPNKSNKHNQYSCSVPVCKAGYYISGSSCTMCTGNEIKSTPGDATDCSADPLCDDATKVPNDDHTACG